MQRYKIGMTIWQSAVIDWWTIATSMKVVLLGLILSLLATGSGLNAKLGIITLLICPKGVVG